MTTLNLYGLGGAGSNIVSHFIKYAGENTEGYCQIKTYFVDTSKSNLDDSIPMDSVYLIDGLDGSGKKRDSNYALMSERSKEILQKFKPSEINVVVHSGAGGKQIH